MLPRDEQAGAAVSEDQVPEAGGATDGVREVSAADQPRMDCMLMSHPGFGGLSPSDLASAFMEQMFHDMQNRGSSPRDGCDPSLNPAVLPRHQAPLRDSGTPVQEPLAGAGGSDLDQNELEEVPKKGSNDAQWTGVLAGLCACVCLAVAGVVFYGWKTGMTKTMMAVIISVSSGMLLMVGGMILTRI